MPRSVQDSSRRRGPTGSSAGGSGGAARPPELVDLDPDDVDPEELREFMAADWVEVQADPGFRERLRVKLWDMLRATHLADEEPGDDER